MIGVVYVLISLCVSLLTYSLIKHLSMNAVRASSLVSLISFLILFGLSKLFVFDIEYISLLVFGASFVGMCSHEVVKSYQVMLSALLFVLIYVVFSPYFGGVGGALGFSAFVSIGFMHLASRCLGGFFKK